MQMEDVPDEVAAIQQEGHDAHPGQRAVGEAMGPQANVVEARALGAGEYE